MKNVVRSISSLLLLFSSMSFSEPKSIIVTGASTWQPFSFINSEGKPDGIMVDFWKLYARINNLDIDFHLKPWSESLDYARDNDNVIHGGLGYSKERSSVFAFSQELPLKPYKVSLFVHKHLNVDKIKSFGDLQVGSVKNSLKHDFLLSQIPEKNIKIFDTFGALIEAALDEKIHIFIDDLNSAQYLMKKNNQEQNFIPRQTLYSFPLHFATNQQSADFLSFIEKGLDKISDNEIQTIYDQWFQSPKKFFPQINKALSEKILWTTIVLFGFCSFFFLRKLKAKNTELNCVIQALKDSTSKLKNISETDALTGAKTRHQLFAELANKRFSNMPYFVSVISIDKLKQINENYGQDMGDMVLKHLTRKLKWQFSDYFYARLCGGEFAVLFDVQDKIEAESKLHQLRKNLVTDPLQVDQQIIPIEISTGIACFPYDERQGEALVRIAANRMRTNRDQSEGSVQTDVINSNLAESFLF